MIQKYSKNYNICPSGISARKKTIYGIYNTHWHDFFEIEYIISGSGKYIIDDMEYEIKENMLFFMTPINFHRVVINGSVEIVNIMFSDDICDSYILSRIINCNKKNAIYFSGADAEFMKNILSELINAANADDKTYYTSLLNTLIIKISNSTKSMQTPKLSYVQSTILFILNNFRKKISLADAAEFVGLSPAYLSSVFSKEANLTFKEYLDNIRLDYSKKMMINSDFSVSEVCFESGFGDYANFIRKFKNKFGVSPGCYRKMHQSNKL